MCIIHNRRVVVMKHLVSIDDLTMEEIYEIVKLGKELESSKYNFTKTNKNLTTIFFENSTRTKMSFLRAGQNIGMNVLDLNVQTSSIHKKETMFDTIMTIDTLDSDVIIVRSGEENLLKQIVNEKPNATIINGGCGLEHPTQALLDFATIKNHFPNNLSGLKVVIVGDVKHSRVAYSNALLLNRVGCDITFVAPDHMQIPDNVLPFVRRSDNLFDSIIDAEVVMGLRVQFERGDYKIMDINDYIDRFQISSRMLDYASPYEDGVILMHPQPVNYGTEFDESIIYDGRNVMREQIISGLYVRMALLILAQKEGLQ
jgi:aspartate carbamoyltransferase catalytic subunit